jgi:hypothetical protein
MSKVKFFICPMSKNIVDSVIEINSEKLGLLPTRRQIDYNGGYVNEWNTKSFTDYVKIKSNIIIQRDHSGANQGNKIGDEYISFEEDLEYFDLIHLDPWIKYGSLIDGTNETVKNIEYIFRYNKNIKFEVGTEEAIRPFSIEELDRYVDELHIRLSPEMFKNIIYVCVQSGVGLDLVNKHNTGSFNLEKLKQMISLSNFFGKQTKEHNGDYLKENDFRIRFDNGLNSINIGPEIAQIETEIYLKHMNQSEIDEFYLICFKSEKWKKWVTDDFDILDKKKLISVCGHYNFNNLPNSIMNDIKITTEVKSIIMNKLNELLSYV